LPIFALLIAKNESFVLVVEIQSAVHLLGIAEDAALILRVHAGGRGRWRVRWHDGAHSFRSILIRSSCGARSLRQCNSGNQGDGDSYGQQSESTQHFESLQSKTG